MLNKTPDSDFIKLEFKMQEKNYVGIDLGKKSMEIVRIKSDDSIVRFNCKTDLTGRQRLIKWLKPNDIIGLEAGNLTFLLVKQIEKELNIKPVVLNPGDLYQIFSSLKKTDKEDCLKIARLLKRNPIEELPIVRIPDAFEEKARFLISEQGYWTKMKVKAMNRLHSLFVNAGITTVTKKDIKNKSVKKDQFESLNEYTKESANRLLESIIFSENSLKEIEKKIKILIREKKEKAEIILSVDGIGIITCLAILGYIGDGSRFSKARQVSYFTGLVPRVDQSGQKSKECKIIKRGCVQLKRTMIQCAWALVKSSRDSDLKTKFGQLCLRKGKKKAIVAIARKMIELVYVLLKKGELYKFMPEEKLKYKLAYYKI